MAMIRRLRAEDRPQWEVLFRAYVAFYETDLADDIYEHAWTRLMSGDVGAHVGFCAVVDDMLVGIAHILFHESTWGHADYCYLEDLFVSPTNRSGGVGRALIEAVYAEADNRNAGRVYWVTKRDNETARGLYDKLATKSSFIQYRR